MHPLCLETRKTVQTEFLDSTAMGKPVKDILYTCTNINVLVIILPVGGPGGGIATKKYIKFSYTRVAIICAL